MMYYEREPEKVIIRRSPTAGEMYLKGFADGYYNRPRTVQLTKKAQAAYSKGYNAGNQARPK